MPTGRCLSAIFEAMSVYWNGTKRPKPNLMRKLSPLLLLALLFTAARGLNAQDAHFSQYYTFAQALNPALTGNFEGSYRFAAIYRNQWRSFLGTNAYVTPGAAIDVTLFEGQLKTDKLGMGLMVYNDRFGEGSISTLNTAFSLAYHKGFGKKGLHRLSLGAQVAFVQKSFDDDASTFYDQFDELTHGAGFATTENFQQGSYFFFDYNFGLYWKSSFSKRVAAQGGFSVWHVSQPQEYFIVDDEDFYLPMRYVFDAGAQVFVDRKYKVSVSPDVLYQRQGGFGEQDFQEILVGGSVGYHFNSGFRTNSSMHVGARYRVSPANTDGLVVLGQVEFRNLRIGGAYDINLSELTESTDTRGGFEVSLVYMGESIRSYKADRSLPARRF